VQGWHNLPLPWTRSIERLRLLLFIWRDSPTVGQGLLIQEVSISTQRRAAVSRTPLDEWSTLRRDIWQRTTLTTDKHPFKAPVGFEPTVSTGERPQTYGLDRAATGTGECLCNLNILLLSPLTTSRKVSWTRRRTGLLPFKWLNYSYSINEIDIRYVVQFVVQSLDWQINCTYCLNIVLLLPCQNCEH
jgi:hypothetical protein